jgi:hypothetical protein
VYILCKIDTVACYLEYVLWREERLTMMKGVNNGTKKGGCKKGRKKVDVRVVLWVGALFSDFVDEFIVVQQRYA